MTGHSWKLVLLPETWTGMSCLTDMRRLWMLPESLKNLRWTSQADKKPLGKAAWYLPYLHGPFMAVSPGKEWKLLSWEMAKRHWYPQDIVGVLENWRNSPKATNIAGKAWCWLRGPGVTSLPWETNWSSSGDSLWDAGKADLRESVWSVAVLVVFMQIIRPRWHWTSCSK